MRPDPRLLPLLFVLCHGAAVLLLSIPPPPPGMRGDTPNASTEAALQAWVTLSKDLGLPEATVERWLRTASPAWGRFLSTLQAPLRPYARLVGANQSWRMFGVVPERVAAFEIDVQTEQGVVPWFRMSSRTHRWPAPLLRQERIRTLIASFESRRGRTRYRALVDVLAAREERPLHFRMQIYTIPDPKTLQRHGGLVAGAPYWEEIR